MSPEPSSERIMWRERGNLRYAYDELARADYYLGCAASILGKTSRGGWQVEADELMSKCTKLRDAIGEEAGA